MSFAAPVVKDRFVFNGDLYIEVENLNRHKRASIAELTALLRPAQKPSKSALPAPPADQVGHWYEAQLLHYGLPPSKTKAVAKVRLLDALNAGKLGIPPEIVRLENEMKKEYQAADRKARAAHKAQMAAEMDAVAKGNGVAAGNKRKHFEDASQPLTKKVKNSAKGDSKEEKPKPEPKKTTVNTALKQPSAKNIAVTKPSAAGPAAQGSSSVPEKPLKKQTAKRSLGPPGNGRRDPDVLRELALKEELAAQTSPSASEKPPKKQTAIRSLGPPGNGRRDPDVLRELALKEEAAFKQKPIKAKKEPLVKKEVKKEAQFKVKKEPKMETGPRIKKEQKLKAEVKTSPAIKKESAKNPTVKQEKVKQEKPREAKPKLQPAPKMKKESTKPPTPSKQSTIKTERPTTSSATNHPTSPRQTYPDYDTDSDRNAPWPPPYTSDDDPFDDDPFGDSVRLEAPLGSGFVGPYYELTDEEDPSGNGAW